MPCALCKTRREKRQCPGVQGEICTVCCGTQREETIDCPFDCEYLHLAHEHEDCEKDRDALPNQDFRIPENFSRENFKLITAMEQAILLTALERNAIDADLREALDGLIRTYRTLESGLVYESRPANPIAAALFDAMRQRAADILRLENEQGLHKVTDHQFLTLFVFLQRMEFAYSNDRKRGRAFLGGMYLMIAELAEQEQADPPSLLVS